LSWTNLIDDTTYEGCENGLYCKNPEKNKLEKNLELPRNENYQLGLKRALPLLTGRLQITNCGFGSKERCWSFKSRELEKILFTR